jgi:hypothetical protein
MHKYWLRLVPVLMVSIAFSFGGCSQMPANSLSWHKKLHHLLPLYGDRNWIAIVDSAYPDQSRAGVETVVTHESMYKVLKYVLAAIAKAPNIRAEAYTDRELQFVTNTQAPGIGAYRKEIDNILMAAHVPHHQRMHIDSIHLLNEKGKIYKILILKTNLTMAYTSVFLHLKCGYWTNADERELRKVMAQAQAAK